MERYKYMISQINPRLLENFIRSVRKDKIYSKEIVVEKLEKMKLLNVRDPILLGELRNNSIYYRLNSSIFFKVDVY